MTLDETLKNTEGWDRIAAVMAHRRKLLVHPQNYRLIMDGVKEYYPTGQLKSHIFMCAMGGVEVIQDPFIPLTTTIRKRRFLTKKQRGKWFVRKYRKVQVPVLGWWLHDSKLSPFRG